MYINGEGNRAKLLDDAIVTHKKTIYSKLNKKPIDASNNPEK